MDPYSPAMQVFLFILASLALASCLVCCYLASEYDTLEEAFDRDVDDDEYRVASKSILL